MSDSGTPPRAEDPVARSNDVGFRALAETAPDAIVSADEHGRITYWNRAAEATFGYSAAEAVGRPITMLMPERFHEAHREGLARFLATGEANVIGKPAELVGRRRDGREFPVEMSLGTWTSFGEVFFTGILRDIGARQQDQLAIASLAAIVESSEDAIIGVSPAGIITNWNRGAGRLYGYAEEEILGRHVSKLVPGDRPDEVGVYLEAVARGEHTQHLETQGVRKGGKTVDVSLSVSRVEDAEGEVVGASVVARDISHRKRTELSLGAQHRATRAIAVATSIEQATSEVLRAVGEGTDWAFGAAWEVDPDSAKSRCAATWTAPRYRRRQIEPFEPGAVFPLADGVERRRNPRWIEDIATCALPGGQEAANRGLRSSIWLPVSAAGHAHGALQLFSRELLLEDGEMLEAMQAVANQLGQFIERKRTERDAERIKDEFFALISHELRTPLTSIIGYTELLAEMEGERLSDQGRNFVEVIDRNARREMRLVRDLLLLVRMESGSFTLEPSSADLAEIVAEAVEAARPRASDQGIELTVESERLAPCAGDPHRLAQVVDNLLSNAIKFTPEGGSVRTRLSSGDGLAVIEVEDSGMGIPGDEQERLFERMYRASGATEQHIPGVGLGLTIVKGIVEAHGGRVGVESEPGAGATFRVELPLASPVSNGQPPSADRSSPEEIPR